jgi:thiamine monophosphate kinase
MRMGDGIPAIDHALHDGEDFELLFTIPEERESEFTSAWACAFDLPCTRIGVMTDQQDLLECIFPSGETVALEGCGYQHFRNA